MNLNSRDFAIFLDYDMVGMLSRLFEGEGSVPGVIKTSRSML